MPPRRPPTCSARPGSVELAETESWVAAARLPGSPGAARPSSPGASPTAARTRLRIVGAHTDSPGLRIHPHADQAVANWRLLGVEVYGGVLLNSWLDRDLGIAGRVVAADGTSTLVDVREPVARVPQLAIHLDREVNDRGLVLDRHVQLRPVWATGASPDGADFADWLGERAGAAPAFWDLCLYDVQPAAVLGADRSLIASGRLDNQVSCWAAVVGAWRRRARPDTSAWSRCSTTRRSVRSRSSGAVRTVARRRHRAPPRRVRESTPSTTFAGCFASSSCVSADNAHAIHPNYAERHDAGPRPARQPRSGDQAQRQPALRHRRGDGGAVPVVLREGRRARCRRSSSRNNMPCGSTIGPLTATRLGIATVDVGVPQLSMHSARELCGAADPAHLVAALAAYWS